MTDKPKGGRSKSPSNSPQVTNGSLVVPAHGKGMIRRGSLPGNTPGTGRPKDVIREKLRSIAAGKGIDFLSRVMDGDVAVSFVGKCPKCHEESKLDTVTGMLLAQQIETSVDQRLKAHEQALKYGIGTQNEQLSEDEGRLMIERTLGRFVDLVRATGLITDTDLNAMYDEALKGLAT